MLILPEYYKNSDVMRQLLQSAKFAFEQLDDERQATFLQFFILKCADVTRFELDVGIAPDTTLDMELRRQRVIAKLRSTPYATKAKLANVIQSFFEGEVPVEVIEVPPFGIKLKIEGETPSLDVLKNIIDAINKILPAHLGMEFETNYQPKNELFLYASLQSYTVIEMEMISL